MLMAMRRASSWVSTLASIASAEVARTSKGRMRKQQPNADDETGTCSICGRRYQNRGHNAQPVDDGRCCDHCNMAVVVPTRLRLAKRTGAADAH